MPRPFYETEGDLANERGIVEALAGRGLHFEKLAPKDILDYAIVKNGRISAFLEIKVRANASTKFDTFMISMAKFQKMLLNYAGSRIPTALVVKFSDRILRLWVNDATPHHVEIGGRYDRGDPDDVEPVVHLGMELFEELNLELEVAS